MNKNESEQFAQATENLLDQPLVPEAPAKEGEEEVVIAADDEEAKNRRERRLKERLQLERESNIALNARLAAIAEARESAQAGEASEYEKLVAQIFGNDTPEKAAATELFKNALKSVEKQSTSNALAMFREEQRKEREAVAESEKRLDSFVEAIEDEHNVVMSPEMKKSYFTLLEKMSPKDSSGSITEFADPHAVWEVFQEKLQKRQGENRSKDLAARGMTQGSSAPAGAAQDEAMKSVLREAGII